MLRLDYLVLLWCGHAYRGKLILSIFQVSKEVVVLLGRRALRDISRCLLKCRKSCVM